MIEQGLSTAFEQALAEPGTMPGCVAWLVGHANPPFQMTERHQG